MKAWEALKAMQEGDGVTDKNGDYWHAKYIYGAGLHGFMKAEPFNIKRKTSKLTAEMVVKASRGAKVYRLEYRKYVIRVNATGEVYLHNNFGSNDCDIDYDADDWVMEE